MRDPGAQPERTWFAWRRTTLTFVVSVALLARTALAEPTAPALLAVSVGAFAWLGMLVTAQRRIRGLARPAPAVMGPGQVLGTLACVLVLIVAGGMLL
ncbi:DUF202 domain-containing protein [Streptomyces albus subsp. chlorinus]|uniref:DUF202 domain-containing protein n=1 Tax=Streptomyces albus TaxID=1888 RepID=UPI00156F6CC5|nr:DUF202 domain-containing protein [Streptomyces albus subsp. chlorinus]